MPQGGRRRNIKICLQKCIKNQSISNDIPQYQQKCNQKNMIKGDVKVLQEFQEKKKC